MNISRRQFVGYGSVAAAALLSACAQQSEPSVDGGSSTSASASTPASAQSQEAQGSNLSLDAGAWRYNADDDVYYQVGVPYCENPANQNVETLAILVPGAYFTATDNGDGTYTCEVNASGTVGSYTSATAPIVMPVNTPGYSAQSPLSDYSSQAAYTGKGCVYVHAGCRGRESGAPLGVVDLKAAIRFCRLVSDKIAGNTDRIFTFGMSGGGAQSALVGATGDAELYAPYLTAIGAASGVSDAVCGSMDWCPITGLDVGDAAYEWMMGCTRAGLSDDEQGISDALAESYAAWVNAAGIVDESGAKLELVESSDGIYQAGSYYERVREAVEESLNNFLADSEFPLEVASGGMGPGAGGPGGAPDGQMGAGGEEPVVRQGEGFEPTGMGHGGPQGAPGGKDQGADASNDTDGGQVPSDQADGIARTQGASGASLSGTYETAQDYIEALNADGQWVTYDEATNTATITSIADFCTAMKQASKELGAFDQLDRGQGENTLFGEDGDPSHFDAMLAKVLEDQGSTYAADYLDDLSRVDALGTDVATRVNMYTPLYFLLESQEGHGASQPAKHWRIRSGISQGDTALTTELNLALALKADGRVESVDFATVWGQGHTMAERVGSSSDNFIAWVDSCLKKS